MRVLFTLIIFLNIQQLLAQQSPVKTTQKESCILFETIVTAATKSFDKERISLQASNNEGAFSIEEYNTTILWPGTVTNVIQVSTSKLEDEQTISFIGLFEKVDTREKAYLQLKKLYSGLIGCSIMPLPGQRIRIKGNIPISQKVVTGTGIIMMDSVFNLNGLKRRVRVMSAIIEQDKKYCAQILVSLLMTGEEVIIPKCEALSEIISQLATKFSGKYDQVLYSKDMPLINGVVTTTTRYKAKKAFPGNSNAFIESYIAKKNGVLRLESWKMESWTYYSSYENALSKYIKVYKQLSGCSIVTPAGRQLQLQAEYSEPRNSAESAWGLIDFKTNTESEKFFISITLEKEDNGYFVTLSVSNSKNY